MKIFPSNIRGIGNSESRLARKDFFFNHWPLLMFVAEPMVPFSDILGWCWNSIQVTSYCLNNRAQLFPNLWALWGCDVTPIVALRNRWHNYTYGGISVLSSLIFHEENCCADKLANYGHDLTDVIWWDSLPMFIIDDFYRDRYGLLSFCFP